MFMEIVEGFALGLLIGSFIYLFILVVYLQKDLDRMYGFHSAQSKVISNLMSTIEHMRKQIAELHRKLNK